MSNLKKKSKKTRKEQKKIAPRDIPLSVSFKVDLGKIVTPDMEQWIFPAGWVGLMESKNRLWTKHRQVVSRDPVLIRMVWTEVP